MKKKLVKGLYGFKFERKKKTLCGKKMGYPCRLCGKTFTRVDNRTRHEMQYCRCLQQVEEPIEDQPIKFQFHMPSSILIVGPSSCGKTYFTKRLLMENLNLFQRRPKAVVYCTSMYQECFEEMGEAGIQFHKGIPNDEDLEQWFPKGQGQILILDDLMNEDSGDKRVLDLFTRNSHHRDITVLYLCQDMFPVGKYAKTISRNAHYIIAFKNPRDQLGVRNVLLQAFPGTWQRALQVFQHVTKQPYQYLVLDLHPASDDDQRLVTRILKDQGQTMTFDLL